MTALEVIVQSYVDWMEIKAPENRKAFLKRLEESPEAARAEAATFAVLRMAGLRPTIGEDTGKGGVDFYCQSSKGTELAVEVTSLQAAVVAEKSGLPHPHVDVGAMTGFSQITNSLLREAVNKAPQLANHPMARVLVIATEHVAASMLMGSHAAEELLTGTTAISLKINDVIADPKTITLLQNSVFFKGGKDGGTIESARRSISVVLLMGISPDAASVIGILHPDPAYVFDPALLPQVHFVRVSTWPIEPGKPFRVEWVGPAPHPTPYHHLPFKVTDEELRKAD